MQFWNLRKSSRDFNLSDKQKIISYLYRTAFTAPVIDFDELLIETVRNVLSKDRMDAESYCNRNVMYMWNALHKTLQLYDKRGLRPQFKILDRAARRLRWYPTELALIGDLRTSRQLECRPWLLSLMDGFNPSEYEKLGATMCTLHGATSVKLTRRGGDAGIDFYAVIGMKISSHVFSGPQKGLRIAGQSKKYASRVGVDRVDRFVKNVEEIRHEAPSVKGDLPAWFRMAHGPIVGWMIAHNGFQSGAVEKARSHGLFLSDSIDVSEVAALSDRLDTSLDPPSRVQILKDMLEGVEHSG